MPHVNFSPVFFDTEHKMAFSYFKEYLRETTVHGFRYKNRWNVMDKLQLYLYCEGT